MACYVFIGCENVAKVVIINVVSKSLHNFITFEIMHIFQVWHGFCEEYHNEIHFKKTMVRDA